MVNSAQPGEVGGCTPFLFYSIYHHEQNKVAVYAPAERPDTLLLFFLYPFLLCGGDRQNLTGRSKTTDSREYNPKIFALPVTRFSGTLLPVPNHITIYTCGGVRWGKVFWGSWRSILWQCRFRLPTQVSAHSRKTYEGRGIKYIYQTIFENFESKF